MPMILTSREFDAWRPPLLTLADLYAIAERCRKATVGGWVVARETDDLMLGGPVCRMNEGSLLTVGTIEDGGPTADPLADAQFIAHARNDLPRLLAEVMRWRELPVPQGRC